MENYFWHIHVLINGGETIATTKFLRHFFARFVHPSLFLLFVSFPCFYLIEWFDSNTRFIFHPISMQSFLPFLLHFQIFQFFNVNYHFLHHIHDTFAFMPCRCFHCTFHTVCDEHCSPKRSHKIAMKIACVLAMPKTTKLNYNHSAHFSHIFSAVIFTWSATIAKNHTSRCTSTIEIQSI